MSLTDLTLMTKSNGELYRKVLGKLTKTELLDCFQCSKCTGGCTAFKLLELVPHEIMKLVKLGFIENLIDSGIIWTCVSCLQCTERCPQRASPYHVITSLRNLAVERQAKVPEAYLKAVSQILETGLMQPVEKVITKKMETVDREKLNLPKIKCPSEEFKAIFLKALEGI
ncbi:MAG: 4Fe-4S dicluster domain-containing protein [Candidatus Bathyarchaeales archaeon]